MDLRVQLGLLLALLVPMFVGCGGGADQPDTVPVSGTITVEGKPLEGAQVSFLGEGASRAAMGTTDAAGKYQLTTFEENDGAIVGKHTVSITKSRDTSGASAENPDASYDELMGGGGAPKPKEGEFTSKSGLDATVTADGPNEIDFDL
jgi:hypothetical protein